MSFAFPMDSRLSDFTAAIRGTNFIAAYAKSMTGSPRRHFNSKTSIFL